MLVYHLALDPFHGALRMLRLFEQNSTLAVEFDHLRILDFCLIFPEFIASGVRLSHQLKARARSSLRGGTQYSGLRDASSAFRRLEPIQRQTVRMLTSAGILTEKGNWLVVGPREVPDTLRARVHARNQEEEDLTRLIAVDLGAFQFQGRDGLKDRSGLLEFRYDPT